MYIVFLNPQGNFDRNDSFWTEHPDFGGQLVYVKEIALAMGELGHKVDIITRRFFDQRFNVFSEQYDHYYGLANVQIVRIPCGPEGFINKEQLWPYLDEWTNNINNFFKKQRQYPDFITGHYGDGGLSSAMLKKKLGIPYSFTGHSLGAQKLDKLRQLNSDLESLDQKYQFAKRIEAERVAIKNADIIFTSTVQEQKEQYTHPLYQDLVSNEKKNFIVAPPGANTRVFSSERQDFDMQYLDKFSKVIARDIEKSRITLPGIISASRLDPKKNHLGLIKAYAMDKNLQNRANLFISLRGVDNAYQDYSNLKEDEIKIMNQIMDIIRSAQIEKKVCFISINSQTELAAFYRYMVQFKSIFTLTALYEPFGLAPIEAMSTGLPAAVTKYGGPADVLNESGKKYGVLIDVFDEKDIAQGLLEVLENHSAYKKLGIERVNAKYTWTSTAKTYLKVINQQLHSKPGYKSIVIPQYFQKPDSHKITLDFIKKIIKETEN